LAALPLTEGENKAPTSLTLQAEVTPS
jgi:hypothetical protein